MSRPQPAPVVRQRGFALLIALWVLVLLTLFETRLVSTGRGAARLAANLHAAARAEAAADGAVEAAIFHLLAPPPRGWVAGSGAHLVRFPETVVEVRIEDEAGKVNPNLASRELLQALLLRVDAGAGTAAAVAAAIVDRRAAGPTPRLPAAPAATSTAAPAATSTAAPAAKSVAVAGRDPALPGAPFRHLEDLGEVSGMTPQLLARLRPHLSLYAEADPARPAADPVVAMAVRDAGRKPPSPGVLGRLRTAGITAVARGPGAARFVRFAVVRIGKDAKDRPWKILVWTTPGG